MTQRNQGNVGGTGVGIVRGRSKINGIQKEPAEGRTIGHEIDGCGISIYQCQCGRNASLMATIDGTTNC